MNLSTWSPLWSQHCPPEPESTAISSPPHLSPSGLICTGHHTQPIWPGSTVPTASTHCVLWKHPLCATLCAHLTAHPHSGAQSPFDTRGTWLGKDKPLVQGHKACEWPRRGLPLAYRVSGQCSELVTALLLAWKWEGSHHRQACGRHCPHVSPSGGFPPRLVLGTTARTCAHPCHPRGSRLGEAPGCPTMTPDTGLDTPVLARRWHFPGPETDAGDRPSSRGALQTREPDRPCGGN